MEATTPASNPQRQKRVLVLGGEAGRDRLTQRVLTQAGLPCMIIAKASDLAVEVQQGAGAVLLERQSLTPETIEALSRVRREQPAWSQLPIILVGRPGPDALPAELATADSLLVLEVSGGETDLTRMVEAALRMRRQQYQVRDQLAEQRLQRIFNSNMIGIVVRDAQGGLSEANDYFLRLVGFTREDFRAGQVRWTDLTPPEHLPTDRKAMDELRREGVTLPYEKEYLRRDGTRVPVLVSLAALPGSQDQMVASVLDITEHKRAEEALHQSERAYRRLFENKLNGMAHGRVIVNEAGRPVDFVFLEVNDTFERMTGLQKQVITGRRLMEIFPDIGTMCFNPIETCAQVAVTGEEGQFEYYQEQLKRWYSVYAYSPRHGDFITIFSDITERKQAEQQLKQWGEALERRMAVRTAEVEERAAQLRRLAEELIQAEERERRRLAEVLHDHLQQMLVGARFSLSILRARLVGDDLRSDAQQVDDMLRQSIATSRSLTAELSPPVLYDAGLAQALDWLAGWMHDKHALTVDMQVDSRINPQEKVRILLFQAVRELLFNAAKHARASRVSVRMHRQDDQVRIEVEDDGQGFDPQEAQARQQGQGGFGLFSIRQRLEWLGGRMEIDSAPGAGTRIQLLAPLQLAGTEKQDLAQEAPLSQVLRQAVAGPGRHPAGEADRIRVLLADDHAVLRDGLAQLLQAEPDIDVVGQAADGRQAVDMALELHPDVVLMDVSMPGLNGVEATRRIKSDLPETRVIGLSMHAKAGMAAAMRQAGARDYLTKSAGPEELVSAIREAAR